MSRLVHLSDEAYQRLRRLKRGSESFSDVVLRTTRRGSLLDLSTGRSEAEIRAHEREIRAIDRMDRP